MFITIDGPDGTGKTSLAHILHKKLNLRSKTIYTCEPTDSELGKTIRKILKSGNEQELSTLKNLFLLDRQEHINSFILPKINEGYTVVCDRYKYSTVCYQHLQGHSISQLIDLNGSFLAPDIAFILYADDVELLLNRIGKRTDEKDLFETKAVLQKALEIYKNMKNYFPNENIVMIDAVGTIEATVADAMRQIENRYKLLKLENIFLPLSQIPR